MVSNKIRSTSIKHNLFQSSTQISQIILFHQTYKTHQPTHQTTPQNQPKPPPGFVELINDSETLGKIQKKHGHGVTGSFKDTPIADWLQMYNSAELEYTTVRWQFCIVTKENVIQFVKAAIIIYVFYFVLYFYYI